MSKFKIIRSEHRERYTALLDSIGVESPNLSLKAKGLLWLLLSRPPEWKYIHTETLLGYIADGKKGLRSAIAELEEHGYLEIKRYRENGKYGTTWTVYESIKGHEAKTQRQDILQVTLGKARAEREKYENFLRRDPSSESLKRQLRYWDEMVGELEAKLPARIG